MATKKYIMIIDDSTITLKQAQQMLKDEFRLAMCKTGKQGLDFIKNNEEKPDLILLDINMPKQDGYEVMAQIMADKNLCKIPVIFLTGDINIENEVRGLRMGAMDFIHKPFVPEIVLSRINRILEVTELRKKLEGQVENKTKELEKLNEYTKEIKHMARTDGLTGIYNRVYFEDMASQYINSYSPVCLFMMDLDNFKSINDSYGHIVGDEVLKKFADTIALNVDGKGIIGRIGGDEFVAIISCENGREDAAIVAKNILNDIKLIRFKFSSGFEVSASIGISVYPDDGSSYLELYNTADKALYYVKQNGKRDFHFYSDRIQDKNEHTSIQADLDAIKKIIGDRDDNKETGAYLIEYDGFKKIYHFLERVVERTNENFQILLFTIVTEDMSVPDSKILDMAMKSMHDVITKYLRKGDVATTFSSCQYIVILTGAKSDEAKHVAQRVVSVFCDRKEFSQLRVKYDNREIEN